MSKPSLRATASLPDWQQPQAPFVAEWQIARVLNRPAGGVAAARYVGLRDRRAGWKPWKLDVSRIPFINVHECGDDGLVYLATRISVSRAAEWELALGHDGGARLFVDGACVLTEPRVLAPAEPGRSCVRLTLKRGRHEIIIAFDLAGGAGWGVYFQACEARKRPVPVILSDLSPCTPASALSARHERGHWKVMPYTSLQVSGKGIWAFEHTGAPEVILPLNATGWHAIYLGIGAGTAPRDPGNGVRVKLSDDAAFQHRGQSNEVWSLSYEEVFFKCADLTAQSLHIAQQTAGYPRAGCVYYVKLLPLTDAEVEALHAERGERSTKRLIGTIDGFSFLYERLPTTKAELLEEFEPFRNTDFGTLWWGFGGADQVNYRSRTGTICGERTPDAPRLGDEYFTQAVRTLADRGIDITRTAVEACHDMGIEIHISMRPAAWKGPVPYEEMFTSDFYDAHPEWRCRDRDGTSVTRMSFAVPEVRQHLLGIFREVLEAGPDGVNLLYNRGVPLTLWEDAFADRFRDLHGEDARTVPEDDPRLYDLRAEFLTQWMREVRQLLDDFQRERGLAKRLKLSAMVLSTEADNRMYGFDVARWVREGLIDQIGVYSGPAAHTSGKPAELAWFKRITAGTNVPVHPGLVAWSLPTAEDVMRQGVEWLDGGADGLLFWDPSAKVKDGVYWPIMSRMGHIEEMRARLAAGKLRPVAAFIHGAGDEPASRWSAWSGF